MCHGIDVVDYHLLLIAIKLPILWGDVFSRFARPIVEGGRCALASEEHRVICSLACAVQSTHFIASEAVVCMEPPIPGYLALQLVSMARFPLGIKQCSCPPGLDNTSHKVSRRYNEDLCGFYTTSGHQCHCRSQSSACQQEATRAYATRTCWSACCRS